MRECMHARMHAWVHAWMTAWMHGCIYAWNHACMDSCIHGCMHAREHTWLHGRVHAWRLACLHSYMKKLNEHLLQASTQVNRPTSLHFSYTVLFCLVLFVLFLIPSTRLPLTTPATLRPRSQARRRIPWDTHRRMCFGVHGFLRERIVAKEIPPQFISQNDHSP